jgi:AcrR family transcriptional regulator
MNKHESENYRVKQAITYAFFELLDSREMNEISISEITEKAQVSRMAYYRNFHVKADIIDYFMESALDEMIDALGNEIHFWTQEYGYEFFSMMKRHKDQILLLEKAGYSGVILRKFNDTNSDFAGDMASTSIERYKLYCAAGAAYNTALQWLQDGCKESTEEISRFTAEFIGIR